MPSFVRKPKRKWPSGLLCIALGVGACGPKRPAPAAAVKEVLEVGVLPRSSLVQGRDGGDSRVAFGKSIWVYGDTVLWQNDARGSNWHTNSWDFTDPGPGHLGPFETRLDSGVPSFFMPLTNAELEFNAAHKGDNCATPPCNVSWALWPGAPVFDPRRGRAWIFYGLFNASEASGIGIARWDRFEDTPQRQPGFLFPGSEPEYTLAPQMIDDDVYVFACIFDGKSKPCTLARAPLEAPEDRSRWTFFDGDGWSKDWHQAKELFEGAPILEVSFNRFLGQWLATYSRPFEKEVKARTAPELTGPWSDELVMAHLKEDHAPYDAVHHAEMEDQHGAVQYITYSRPTGETWFSGEHVVLKVTLERR